MGALIGSALAQAGFISASSVATAAFVANAAIAITSVAYQQSRARKAAKAASIAGQGSPFSVQNTDAPRSLIVGRALVPIERMVYMQTHGTENEKLVMVCAFGAHEVDAIEDILFNGKSIGALDGSGYVTTGDYFRRTQFARTLKTAVPPSGQSIAMPAYTTRVVSIAEANSSDNIPFVLDEGTDYTLTYSGGGYISAINITSSDHQGVPVVVSYRDNVNKALVRAVKFTGASAGQRDTELEALDAKWTSDHVGKDVPRVKIELIWDSEIFGSIGVPEIKFVVRGAKCYDYATTGTTWTANAARICAWYLQRPEGFGAAASDIDSALALTAQNICDETVAYGESGEFTQSRYTCNGVIDTTAAPIQTLQQLLGSMAGLAVPVGATWDLRAGAAETPTYTLEDSDLAGGVENFVSGVPIGERVNSIRGRYTDAALGYIVRDASPYSSSTYVSEDGKKIWDEHDLPFTTDAWAAQRIQRLALHISRNAAIFSAKYNLGAYPVRAGMSVYLRHTEYGWDSLEGGAGKRFLVLRRGLLPSGEVELTMIEVAPAVYSWTYNEATAPDPAPNTSLPSAWYVAPIVDLSVRSGANTYDIDSTGTKTPYVGVTWAALPESASTETSTIVLRWKHAGESSYHEETLRPSDVSAKLRPAWAGMLIDGHIYVVNSVGVKSAPMFFDHLVSASLANSVQAISSNWLTNATFDGGYAGWEFSHGNNGVDVYAARKPLIYRIIGSPTNIGIDQQGSGDSASTLKSGVITATGDKLFAVSCGCLPFGCRARIQVQWLDALGNTLDFSYGGIIESTPQGGDPRIPNIYQRSWFIQTAPSGAVGSILWLVKFGTLAGGTASTAYFHKPFFGEVPAGTQKLPEWSPGVMSSVYPALIEPGATTEVESAGSLAEITVTGSPYYTDREVLSWTPTATGSVEVTVWANLHATSSGSAYIVEAGIYPSGLQTQGKQTLSMRDQVIVPAGDIAIGNIKLTETYTATAGQPASIFLRLGRRTKVATKPVPPPTPPAGTDVAFDVRARARLYKN